MSQPADISAKAAALRAQIEARGAVVLDPPVLQPAETLLDLYGEDIRGRAYVTSDALRGEQMLRPDFTVPVVQMHMADGAEPARYTYAGTVFRRQEDDPERPNEYVQVGYEIFDRADPAAADAEVFALINSLLAGLPVQPVTGDIAILMAAVQGLDTTARRKAALMRHIWRPARFRALLDRFSGKTPVPASRAALLKGQAASDAPLTGLRTQAEVDARIALLREDAAAPPLAAAEVALVETLLGVAGNLPDVTDKLHGLTRDLPAIGPAVDGLTARTAALKARGIDTDALRFEVSFGRTQMEYYDGFVFGFRAQGRAGLPTVASGGRYDALTARLGHGAAIPAVGGVMRPDLMQLLEGAA